MTKFEELLASVDALRALIVEAAKEVPPTVKVLVMPPQNSKEEFALSAMAEAMGLTVADATLVESVGEVEDEVIVPTEKATSVVADMVQEVMDMTGLNPEEAFQSLKDTAQALAQEEPEVIPPPEEPQTFENNKGWDWRKDIHSNVAEKGNKAATGNGIRISKATGKPVRKYERSGKFAKKADEPVKKPYRARRMS